MRTRLAVFCALSLLLWFSGPGRAYSLLGRRWAAGSSIVMHLQLGSPSGSLIDGSTSWNPPTENALAAWSSLLNTVSVRVVRDSTSGTANGNALNNVIFGDDVYGEPFGSETLAVTVGWYRTSDNTYTERDVVFNRKFSWNSYRGNLRNASGGGRLQDFQRVALHEFGHVIGLDHPDDHGQSVTAIMNSRIGNPDSLQTDDTNGARAIYGTAPAAPVVTDTLQSGARLTPGQSVTSTNKRYRLVYQNDGNLVLYDDVDRTVPWATGTAGTSPGVVLMQGDGNLVLYDGQEAARWWTATDGNANARLLVQNDGNVVIYGAEGQAIWDRNR
jgi:hypothetical protein